MNQAIKRFIGMLLFCNCLPLGLFHKMSAKSRQISCLSDMGA